MASIPALTFSSILDPHLTAKQAVDVLGVYNESFPPITPSDQRCDDEILLAYYIICRANSCVHPLEHAAAIAWAKRHFDKYPGYRIIAVTTTLYKKAIEATSALAAERTETSLLSNMLVQKNIELAAAQAHFQAVSSNSVSPISPRPEVKSPYVELLERNALMQAETTIAALAEDLDNAQNQLAEATAKIAKLEKEVADTAILQETLLETQNQVTELQTVIDSLKEQSLNIDEMIASLNKEKNQLAEATAEISELKKKEIDTAKLTAELKEAHLKVQRELLEANARIAQLQAENEALSMSLGSTHVVSHPPFHTVNVGRAFRSIPDLEPASEPSTTTIKRPRAHPLESTEAQAAPSLKRPRISDFAKR